MNFDKSDIWTCGVIAKKIARLDSLRYLCVQSGSAMASNGHEARISKTNLDDGWYKLTRKSLEKVDINPHPAPIEDAFYLFFKGRHKEVEIFDLKHCDDFVHFPRKLKVPGSQLASAMAGLENKIFFNENVVAGENEFGKWMIRGLN